VDAEKNTKPARRFFTTNAQPHLLPTLTSLSAPAGSPLSAVYIGRPSPTALPPGPFVGAELDPRDDDRCNSSEVPRRHPPSINLSTLMRAHAKVFDLPGLQTSVVRKFSSCKV